MKTLQYFSLPLVKFQFYSSFLLFLLSCSPMRIQASETKFLIFDVGSQLSSSVCTSPSTIDSLKLGQSTMEVLHRDSPCALNQDTTKRSMADILRQDQLRVDSIQDRNKINDLQNPNAANNDDNKQAKLPALSGNNLGTGNYIVTVSIGNPGQKLTLAFDTGSDLTWTQCEPCVKCYKQKDPIFNPSTSKQFSSISCKASTCRWIKSATGYKPGCTKTRSACGYIIGYGDGSVSIGSLSNDTLTITSTDKFPNFLFGCAQNNKGLFGETSGLLGLGRGPLSTVSQTATQYKRVFSYCLPSTLDGKGFLAFGSNKPRKNTLKFTPLVTGRVESFYYIEIISIAVGGESLPITPTIFKTSGTIIDSGTVITRLPMAAYTVLRDNFKKQMNKYKIIKSPLDLLDTCYDTTGLTTLDIPTISFTFQRGVTIGMGGSGILVHVDQSIVCLAFAGNRDTRELAIFGNAQQKTLEVVYDVAGGQIGFGAGGCE